MTRREQALKKILRLERELETTITDPAVERIIREINRLQLVYGITLEEIREKRFGSIYKRLHGQFPFLSQTVIEEIVKSKRLHPNS